MSENAKVPEKVEPIGEFTIEFGDDQNSRFRWPMDGRDIRGWWKKENLRRTEFNDNFAPMPNLPGLRMRVVPDRKIVEIVDPLSMSEFKTVAAKAADVIKATFNERQSPEEKVVLSNLTESEIKQYCWWCRRFLDAAQCVELVGKVPTVEAVKRMPGKITTNNFDLSANGRKPCDIPANYRPAVV